MDIGSIFLILGLLILVGLYISRPFFEKRKAATDPAGHQQSALLAERDRILNSLQELDFDYTLGKIPEADYPIQRNVLMQQGAEVLRELDAYQQAMPPEPAEARLEAAIAARRAETMHIAPGSNGLAFKPALAHPDDDLEGIIANRRRERSEKAVGFCPQCGNPVQKSDRFCPKCGTTITSIP
jgi:rubrerythrin